MKKILFFILIAISLNGLAQDFPGVQSLSSPTTRLIVNGGLDAKKGMINGNYVDTTAANLGYIDFHHGAQIWTTSDKNLWLRDSVLNMWVRMAKFSEVGSYTFTNGLTESGGTVKLGGTLSDATTTLTGGANSLAMTFNSLGGGNGLNITSNSTLASGNSQKLVNLILTGANANSNQTTYGLYSVNSHTGTGSTNYGLYGTSSSGGNTYGVGGAGETAGIYGTSNGIVGRGVYGTSASYIGVQGDGTTGVLANGSNIGVLSQVQGASSIAIQTQSTLNSTNDERILLDLIRGTSGTAAAGIGGIIRFQNQADDGGYYPSNYIQSISSNATLAGRTSRLDFQGVNSTTTNNLLSLEGSGRAILSQYGSGTFTGTATKFLAVTSTGIVIEEDAPGGGSESTTASNVGAGSDVFKQLTGSDLEFRTLVAGDGIAITENANDITITSVIDINNNDEWYPYKADMGNPSNAFLWTNSSGAGSSAGTAGDVFLNWVNSRTFQTGTTTTGLVYMHHGNNSLIQPISLVSTARYSFRTKIRFEDLSDGTETYKIWVGFADDHTFGAPVDACMFTYTHSDSSGQFVCKVVNNSSVTAVASGVTVAADTDYILEVTVIGGSSYFYINKVLVATISGVPDDDLARVTSMNLCIRKSAGTTNRKMYVEEVWYGRKSN